MTVRARSNPWLAKWRASLRGMRPQPQVVGYWLAEQADEDGVIDGVDWEKLGQDTSLTINTLRRELREDGELLTSGRVTRETRQWGNTFGATKYQLHVKETKDLAT